jgi:RND family efflux transporter MFP subunit
VPVERAPHLRIGMPVQILDSTGAVLADSRVRFISPQVDSQTQTVLVKAAIENAKSTLRTAQFIRARIIWATHEGTVVAVLAVSRVGGQYFAFVAEESKGSLVARQRPVRVGEIVGNDYVIREGIKPGDRVIVSGTQFLVDGAPVSPQG